MRRSELKKKRRYMRRYMRRYIDMKHMVDVIMDPLQIGNGVMESTAFGNAARAAPLYRPGSSALELPVQVGTVRCRPVRPIYFPPAPGKTPSKTLAKAFKSVVRRMGCPPVQAGRECGATGGGELAECPDPACPLIHFYNPRAADGKPLARPAFLYSEALNGDRPVDRFDLRITLWGRVAIAHRPWLERVLEVMGTAGLRNCGESVPFRMESIAWGRTATLQEMAEELAAQGPERLLLQFPVPFRFVQTVTHGDGRQTRHIMAAGELPIREMLANCAYHTAAADLDDRARSGQTVPDNRHPFCREAREQARRAAAGVRPLRSDLSPAFVGRSGFRANGESYPQDGFVGQAELGGDLAGAIPWLVSLAMGGGGQHRSDGFGVVRLWAAPFS